MGVIGSQIPNCGCSGLRIGFIDAPPIWHQGIPIIGILTSQFRCGLQVQVRHCSIYARGNRTLDDLSAFISGGWEKQGEILPINENVDSWSLMLAELNSPIVLVLISIEFLDCHWSDGILYYVDIVDVLDG